MLIILVLFAMEEAPLIVQTVQPSTPRFSILQRAASLHVIELVTNPATAKQEALSLQEAESNLRTLIADAELDNNALIWLCRKVCKRVHKRNTPFGKTTADRIEWLVAQQKIKLIECPLPVC